MIKQHKDKYPNRWYYPIPNKCDHRSERRSGYTEIIRQFVPTPRYDCFLNGTNRYFNEKIGGDHIGQFTHWPINKSPLELFQDWKHPPLSQESIVTNHSHSR